jgi:hypothetical protein
MNKTAITISVTISTIAVILFALTTNSWGFLMSDASSVKKNMEEYLRNTYGKEFVLNEPRLVGGG